MKTLGIVLVIAGIVGLLVGGGLYLFMTKRVEITTVPITIEKAIYYTGQTSAGFLGPKEAYYSLIQVEPTVTAQPNTDYLITTNNGITAQTYSVSWNQAELAISKLKTITDRISQDAITGLQQKSQYTVNISEKVAQHDIIYIIPGILFFVLGAILWVMSVVKEPVGHGEGVDVTNQEINKESQRDSVGATNLNINEQPPESNYGSTGKPPYETIYVDPRGIAYSSELSEILAKRIEKERVERIENLRRDVFNNYRNIVGNGLFKDPDAKWYELISRATSESELNNLNEVLNSHAGRWQI